jgi:hypothetical protein
MHITIIKQHIEDSAHHLLIGVHKEAAHTKEAAVIIRKYIVTGSISDDEEVVLKVQLADTLKIVGIVVPFILIPGASVIIPILIKVAGKHNINLMPSVMQ